MINRIIWTYWYQGLENAPPVITKCVNQWQKINPGWELRFVDRHNMHDFVELLPLSDEKLNKMSLAVSSDLLKLQLLIKYGGVWVDATVFPLVSLDEWLLDKLDAGYFYFYKPGRDRIISSWFIVAEENNMMLKNHYTSLINYWKNNDFKYAGKPSTSFERYLYRIINRNPFMTKIWFTPLFTKILRVSPYLVTHYMFYKIISSKRELMNRFQAMPKVSAKPLNSFSRDDYYKVLNNDFKSWVDNKKTPMIKLNWKTITNEFSNNTNLAYLFKQ